MNNVSNVIEEINQLDFVFENPATVKVQFVKRLLEKPVVKAYLFQKLSKNFNPSWFFLLFELRYFAPETIPGPIIIVDENGKEMKGFQGWQGSFVIWEAAKFNAIETNFSLTKILLELIDDYINYAYLNKENTDRNFATDYYFCQFIFLLPLKQISQKHINFINDFGLSRDRSILSNDLTEKLFLRALDAKDERLIYKLLELFFSPTREKNEMRLASVIEDYYVQGFAKEIPEKLFKCLHEGSIEWAIRKLDILSRRFQYQFLKFNITSLEPDMQNSPSEGLNFAIVDLLVGLFKQLENSKLRSYILRLLQSKRSILKRIAFFFIDQQYNSFYDIFWEQENPLNFFEGKLEIFRIINRHCTAFKKIQVDELLENIDKLKILKEKYGTSKDRKRYLAYKKLEWLSALEPIFLAYPEIVNRYNNLKKTTSGQTTSHPGYDSYFEVRPGGEYDEVKRIFKLPTRDVVNLLNNPTQWNGYNGWGLEQDLRDYVINNLELVTKNLNDFKQIPISFLYNFIDGFRSLSEKKVIMDFNVIYEFITDFIADRNELWDNEKNVSDRSNSIGMIAWLIDSVSENSAYELNIGLLEKGNNILLFIEKNYHLTFKALNNDPGFDIINSTRGKIYRAMISSSLRELKINPRNGVYWNSKIRERFTERVTDGSLYPEFYWSVGFMTPQISYLDFNWLSSNKSQLFIYREEFDSDPPFYGYLLRSSELYSNLFQLLKDRYEVELDTLTERNSKTQRLVEHILIAFIAKVTEAEPILEKLLQKPTRNKLGT